MNEITTLDRTHDLVHSQDDNGWYIQEYKLNGKGTTRTSRIYKTSKEAETAFEKNTVKYGKWE